VVCISITHTKIFVDSYRLFFGDREVAAAVRTTVLMHLPRDGDSGTVVAFDPGVARRLGEFVADIRADLYEA